MERTMNDWLSKLSFFFKKWRVFITIALFVLVFIGLAMPLFLSSHVDISSHLEVVIEDGEEISEWVFTIHEVGAPGAIWISSLFTNGTNVLAILLFLVFPFLPLLLSIWGYWKKEAMVAAALCGYVFSILVFISPSIFDCGQSLAQLGIASGGLGYFDFTAAAETEIDAGPIVMAVLSFLASTMALASSSEREEVSVQSLAEVGVLSALAIGLQFIKVPVGLTGGSINLGLVPLAFLALRHGPAKGFVAGAFIFGLVTCLTDGYGIYTYPFDYLIGFGSIAVYGFFKNLVFVENEKGWSAWGFFWIFVASTLSSFVRFVGSTTSSMVLYGYDFYGACTYNAFYIFVTGIVTFAVLSLLYIPLAKVQQMFPPVKTARKELSQE